MRFRLKSWKTKPRSSSLTARRSSMSNYARFYAAEHQARSSRKQVSLKGFAIRIVILAACIISLWAGLYQIFLAPKPAHAQTAAIISLREIPIFTGEGTPPNFSILSHSGFPGTDVQPGEVIKGVWVWQDPETRELVMQGYVLSVNQTADPIEWSLEGMPLTGRFSTDQVVDAHLQIMLLPDQHSQSYFFYQNANWYRSGDLPFDHLFQRQRVQIKINKDAEIAFR